MSGLDQVLVGLGATGATLSKGIVASVQTGTISVTIDGGTFTRVTVLKGSWTPVVGEQVFLLSQADFGTIALGSPQAAPAPPAPTTPTVTVVDPSTIANWQVNAANPLGAWASTLGSLVQAKDGSSSGVWFYDPADLVFPGALGGVEMQLAKLSGDYPELVLHTNAGPVGAFAPSAEAPLRLNLPVSSGITWVSLPLAWGRSLLDGTAKGIAVSSQIYDATLDAYGSLRFTSL